MNESDLDGIKITIGEKGDYETLKEDVYEVMIENIKKEMRPTYHDKSKEELTLNFTFNIVEGDYAGRKIFKWIRPMVAISPNPSHFYKLMCAIENDSLDGTFFEGFKLPTILGKFIRVTIKNKVKGENTYSNIESFLPTKMDTTPGDQTKKKKAETTEEMVDELVEETK